MDDRANVNKSVNAMRKINITVAMSKLRNDLRSITFFNVEIGKIEIFVHKFSILMSLH